MFALLPVFEKRLNYRLFEVQIHHPVFLGVLCRAKKRKKYTGK